MSSMLSFFATILIFVGIASSELQRFEGVPTVEFCNKTLTPLVINSYSLNPDDIKSNEHVTLQLFATLTEEVTSGTIQIEAKIGFIPVYNQKYDLCTEVAAGGMKCPLPPNQYNITQTVDIPDTKIHGTIKADMQLTDQNNAQLACMSVQVHV